MELCIAGSDVSTAINFQPKSCESSTGRGSIDSVDKHGQIELVTLQNSLANVEAKLKKCSPLLKQSNELDIPKKTKVIESQSKKKSVTFIEKSSVTSSQAPDPHTCACGLAGTTCCLMRREILSTVRKFINDYPQFKHNFAKFCVNNGPKIRTKPRHRDRLKAGISKAGEKQVDTNNKEKDGQVISFCKYQKREQNVKATAAVLNSQERLVQYINQILEESCGSDSNELRYQANDDLKVYAEKLVAAGMGYIVEGRIAINRNKNHQSFVETPTDRESTEPSAMIMNPAGRQYAFQNDIVSAFVFNHKSTSSELPITSLANESQQMTVAPGTTSTSNDIAKEILILDSNKVTVIDDKEAVIDTNADNCKGIVKDEDKSIIQDCKEKDQVTNTSKVDDVLAIKDELAMIDEDNIKDDKKDADKVEVAVTDTNDGVDKDNINVDDKTTVDADTNKNEDKDDIILKDTSKDADNDEITIKDKNADNNKAEDENKLKNTNGKGNIDKDANICKEGNKENEKNTIIDHNKIYDGERDKVENNEKIEGENDKIKQSKKKRKKKNKSVFSDKFEDPNQLRNTDSKNKTDDAEKDKVNNNDKKENNEVRQPKKGNKEQSGSEIKMIVDDLDAMSPSAATSHYSPKAFVIKILSTQVKQPIVGHINCSKPKKLPEYGDKRQFFNFSPLDKRTPTIYIEDMPTELLEQQKSYLYSCQVLNTDDLGYCMGKLLEPIGVAGELSSEIKAILQHNGLNHIRPFDKQANEVYAKELQVTSGCDASDLAKREDFTKQCIFTIDPLTARDLDDALSVEQITANEYEVGVHISDVAHYVKENSDLDNIVKDRCTSIYMVNEVIHMLPEPLCMHCSLLPGKEKYAFSVIWRFSEDGKILNTKPKFTRSIVSSCAQLAYEHAQFFIDNAAEIEKLPANKMPSISICNGFTMADIYKRVIMLNKLATILRKERFEAGSLTINNHKLRFVFDEKTGEPLKYELEKRLEANFMIEEFMLLANQTVAKFIHDHYPDISVLRHHPPPLLKSMRSLSERLAALGIHLDYSTSKTVQQSIERICRESRRPDDMNICLSTLLMKPMARAKYFCSEGKTERDLWHYALSIPIYTHFTSPIRRYPDILVHRLLAAALKLCEAPERSIDELQEILKTCNETQLNAKNADDESSKLFFMRYVRNKSQIVMSCLVTEIMAHTMNVVTVSTGHVIPIHYSQQKVWIDASQAPKFVSIYEENSKKVPKRLEVTSSVEVNIVVKNDVLVGYLLSPDLAQRKLNSIQQEASRSENQLKKKKH